MRWSAVAYTMHAGTVLCVVEITTIQTNAMQFHKINGMAPVRIETYRLPTVATIHENASQIFRAHQVIATDHKRQNGVTEMKTACLVARPRAG